MNIVSGSVVDILLIYITIHWSKLILFPIRYWFSCHVVRYDGLLLSVGGNGRSFVMILEAGPSADTSQSKLYFARISTKVGFCRVRNIFTFRNTITSWLNVDLRQWSVAYADTLTFRLSHLSIFQVRVPFSSFRPVKPDDPPLDRFLVHTLTIRFEPRRQVCISPILCQMTVSEVPRIFFVPESIKSIAQLSR